MRMWMVDPKLLCNKHLLGEHGEIHKFRPSFVKKHSIKGRIEPVVQIEPLSMKTRHDALAQEMKARGMRHRSPYRMPSLLYLPVYHRYVKVERKQSFKDLSDRCKDCSSRMMDYFLSSNSFPLIT